ncbi:small integral membrane protein 13-like [Patiria miniata]|uniref:Small integral membrane protein 13 n=1 Tax=Patiria miniata TaxID=46514 RepID=A0A914B3C8_PATMI|nr:small integral membrane protein 13-like [Patiria miniata]
MANVEIQDIILMIVSFLTSLAVVLIFIVVGWYIVWVAFLSRFKLMRELLSVNDEETSKDKEAKSLASSSSSSASSERKGRQHVTSQRT